MGLFDILKKKRNESLSSFNVAESKTVTIPMPFDFAGYDGVIIMHLVSVEDIERLIADYNEIYDDNYQFDFQIIDEHDEWIIIRIPENMRGDFWAYSNMILWMSQKCKDVFGYAWNDGNTMWAAPNIEDKLGETLFCLHNNTALKCNVPENTMKRLLLSEDIPTPKIYIKMKHQFDVEWIK